MCTGTKQAQQRADGGGFALLGTDGRLAAAGERLCAQGLRMVPPAQADFALLGAPTPTLAPYAAAIKALRPQAVLFAGGLSQAAAAAAAAAGLRAVDYLRDEALARYNAIPTAEGALGILLGATPDTLWRARVLVVGYGRLGQALVPRLLALGCRVQVAARDAPALALAAGAGASAAFLERLPALCEGAQLLVNTVPSAVVGAAALARLPKGAFVLELASAPGGVDLAAAAALGVRVQVAGGLPGRCAPRAAGRAVGDTVLRCWRRLQEKGETDHA